MATIFFYLQKSYLFLVVRPLTLPLLVVRPLKKGLFCGFPALLISQLYWLLYQRTKVMSEFQNTWIRIKILVVVSRVGSGSRFFLEAGIRNPGKRIYRVTKLKWIIKPGFIWHDIDLIMKTWTNCPEERSSWQIRKEKNREKRERKSEYWHKNNSLVYEDDI